MPTQNVFLRSRYVSCSFTDFQIYYKLYNALVTNCFITWTDFYKLCNLNIQEYATVKSPPVYISPLDLGPKYADKMGSGFQEYCKTYGENYCLGQLIYWYSQTNADPDCRLGRAQKGCLSLPDISSFYAKSHKPLREHVYSSRTLRFMLSRMVSAFHIRLPCHYVYGFFIYHLTAFCLHDFVAKNGRFLCC